MKVVVTKQAQKDLAKLQPEFRKKVYDTLDKFAKSQQKIDVKKLTGRSESRIRVGDYRILIEISNEEIITVYALRVLHRREAYR
ncbi:MAG: type II toxin-antitoxin system RelE family toxin [Desulfitobacteriaceae bacterium]